METKRHNSVIETRMSNLFRTYCWLQKHTGLSICHQDLSEDLGVSLRTAYRLVADARRLGQLLKEGGFTLTQEKVE
jgi:predicted DNA-binding transcriptional regulator YafY